MTVGGVAVSPDRTMAATDQPDNLRSESPRTNRQIAEALFISENTAGVHVSNILGKMGASTRTEAAGLGLGVD